MSLWAYAVCVALVALAVVPAAAADACTLYTSCADCTCNTLDYDISTNCLSGCAWDVASATCKPARGANRSSSATYYSLWLDPDAAASKAARIELVQDGLTTCQLHKRTCAATSMSCHVVPNPTRLLARVFVGSALQYCNCN